MRLLHQSLGIRVLVLVTVVTALTFLGLFLANTTWQNRNTLEILAHNSERTADLMLMSIEEPMRLGKNAETTHQFEKMAAREPLSLIYLTDFRGNVTYSTRKDALRKDMTTLVPGPVMDGMLHKGLAGNTGSEESFALDGKQYYAIAKAIKNEPECHHCHGSSKPVLGAIVMLQDITATKARASSDQLKTGLMSLGGMAALLIVLMSFMRKAVLRPIQTIARNTALVREGRHDVDFTMKGEDELAGLSSDLAQMVNTIQDQLQYNQSVLSGIIVPLFVTNERGAVAFANPPLLSILCTTETALAGKMADATLNDYGNHLELAASVLATGATASGMLHHKCSEGTVYPMHYEISPLKSATGKTVGVIGVLMDLTKEEEARTRIEAQRQNLMEVAQEVTSVSAELLESANSLTNQMQELSRGVDDTAAQTAHLATAMDQMNDTVLNVAKNAGETAQASETAQQAAKAGGEEVRRTVEETRRVASRAEELASSLAGLTEQAMGIGQVMGVVGDIADQTNLLALNAAIEAARAGEAGRGFAVVADEVRKLAEKTMQATGEVAKAIRDIQDSTRQVAQGMADTTQSVEHTASMAENSGTVLEGIVEQSGRIADRVHSIATAAEEQSSTSEGINQNVSYINTLSQDIAERIQEANTGINTMRELARHLAELAQRFTEDDTKKRPLPA